MTQPDDIEFRVEYQIARRRGGDLDFVEIGFGSSGAWDSIGACAHSVSSALQNRCWETEPGMPEPADAEVTMSTDPRHACPGGCGRTLPYRTLACRECWTRLPQLLRDNVRIAYARRGSDPRAHMDEVTAAARWYRDNREGLAQRLGGQR